MKNNFLKLIKISNVCSFLSGLKVRTKVIALSAFLLAMTVLIALVAIVNQTSANNKNEEKLKLGINEAVAASADEGVKERAETVVSYLDSIYEKQKSGEYSSEEAMTFAAELVRNLNSGENGYYWIDTYDGINVVNSSKDTEGANRLDAKDGKNTYYIKNLIAAGQEDTGGYVDYYLPTPGKAGESKVRGYAIAFEPYHWVISTNYYYDSLNARTAAAVKTVSSKSYNGVASVVVILLIAILGGGSAVYFIAKTLNEDFVLIMKYINVLAAGDFSEPVTAILIKKNDDFGNLARKLEMMKESVARLIGNVKVEADEIRKLADQSKDAAIKINGVIEEVVKAVNNLSGSAKALLQYVSTDISESFQKFLTVTDAYKNDAVFVDNLITDFSATSEELLASVNNITQSIKGVAQVAAEGATGTGDIAKRIAGITEKSTDMNMRVKVSLKSTSGLQKEISNFTI